MRRVLFRLLSTTGVCLQLHRTGEQNSAEMYTGSPSSGHTAQWRHKGAPGSIISFWRIFEKSWASMLFIHRRCQHMTSLVCSPACSNIHVPWCEVLLHATNIWLASVIVPACTACTVLYRPVPAYAALYCPHVLYRPVPAYWFGAPIQPGYTMRLSWTGGLTIPNRKLLLTDNDLVSNEPEDVVQHRSFHGNQRCHLDNIFMNIKCDKF